MGRAFTTSILWVIFSIWLCVYSWPIVMGAHPFSANTYRHFLTVWGALVFLLWLSAEPPRTDEEHGEEEV